MNINLCRLTHELSLTYLRFIQLAEILPPEKHNHAGICGHWSPKDVISHLIGWDKSLCDFIKNPDAFDPEPLHDVHAFNAKSVSDRHALTWELTMDELKLTFSELREALEIITPEIKIYERVQSWVSGRVDDYRLHSTQLEDWIEKDQETPA